MSAYSTKAISSAWICMILGPTTMVLLAMNFLMFIDTLFFGFITNPYSWVLLPALIISWISHKWADQIVMEYVNSGEFERDREREKRDERS